jgi:hypothetical protein
LLDPFAWSETRLGVAKSLGRDHLGIELNAKEYGPRIEMKAGRWAGRGLHWRSAEGQLA